eukprot:COSAG02_NODE_20_length_53673_cov_86.864841_29_plen_140_part_00
MVPHLVEHLLKEFAEVGAAASRQPAEPVWIGRRGPKHMKGKNIWPFAMGGAGYCMDHRAALELARQNLVDECTIAQQPDDMTIGLVMQRQNVALRHTPQFHSQCKHTLLLHLSFTEYLPSASLTLGYIMNRRGNLQSPP